MSCLRHLSSSMPLQFWLCLQGVKDLKPYCIEHNTASLVYHKISAHWIYACDRIDYVEKGTYMQSIF